MMKKYFFSKTKVEMYYNKRDKMIMMPLFAYNIYYVVILLSFFETYLSISQFRGNVVTYLKIAIDRPKRSHDVIYCMSCEGQDLVD
jgi:hypothetical protein